MPIIDFHVHSPEGNSAPQSFVQYLYDNGVSKQEVFSDAYKTPQTFLKLMDENGVDYAVLVAEMAPITSGRTTNERIAELCSASPRLIPFASINPLETQRPGEELKRLVHDEGFRGLKLYPPYQYFYPNDSMLYPLYAAAQELGIPVMFHTGSSVFKGARLKYGEPLYLDDVAVDFPELKIVLSHGGRPFWYDQAAFLARLHPNVFIDTAGLPPQRLLAYFPELERTAHKVVFGSDWPGLPTTVRSNIEAVRSLPISDSAKESILGGTALTLLPWLHAQGDDQIAFTDSISRGAL